MENQLIADRRTKYPQLEKASNKFEGISALDSYSACVGYTTMQIAGLSYHPDTWDIGSFEAQSAVAYTDGTGAFMPIERKESQILHVLGELGKNFKAINPLPIRVTYEGNEVLCEIPELEIYSFTTSIPEGINEIYEEIEDLILVLNSEPSLGSAPKEWKHFIDKYIQFDSDEF